MIKVEHAGVEYYGANAASLLEMGVPLDIVTAAVAARALADAQASRRQAYAVESDPLYLEWQYDQTPEAEQAWRDKVAEIKARYPLPAEA
ncbi:hypothetical protein SAMN05216600_12834 [Pseudomonas cuatrocienegasensis]|uniref:Uncharacterized protein n=1 Tax=Pseudomonas cuatrocienegasensis TaxID=543360 RepID=A0ABY1BQZ0_9PSED|nr:MULTISPECIES: hypothetical protein [Pseudomonas]OEC32883.1 hypothetical protein A7D25_21815 [Pseudomonas sp. 21C1]SER41380.1 hypothetical protein SAMN05216600_12834 [Pseudomonas cuatrocienegasensis]